MIIVAVALSLDRKLMRREPDGTLITHADLTGTAPGYLGDVVVDAQGRAYLGNFGFDLHGGEPSRTTCLICVEPDGSAHAAAQGLGQNIDIQA